MAAGPPPSVLSEEMLRVIRGEVTHDEKKEQYKESLHRCVLQWGFFVQSRARFERSLQSQTTLWRPIAAPSRL
jgi:hypothetical protein